MAPERAYLIVSQPSSPGSRVRARTPARTRPAPSAAPRTTASPRPPHRGDGTPVLVRRHRPGRHRVGEPGLRHYRRVTRHGDVTVRPRLATSLVPGRLVPARPGRHVAPRAAAARGATVARYASLVVVLSTVLISGWFAASGASAFAQLIRH